MYRTFELFDFGLISTYNLMIGVGIFFGFLLIEKSVSREIKFKDHYKLHITLFLSFIFGFIGSRIFDIIFFEKELNFLNFLTGSSTFIGGLIFSVLFIILFTSIVKLKTTLVLELLVPFLIVAHFFGRIGCFLGGCCYGKPTDSFLGVKYPEDSFPYQVDPEIVDMHLHPTQLYESFALLVIYFILKNKPNKVSSYLILYGVVRFIIEFFRNDPRGSFLTDFFSPSQELSLLFIITGFLYFKFLENKRTTYPL
ncbi:MAG: hypothetical protein CMC57_00165 [Flavobacteriaceae bacterium]|nr:hypothetical protein [Flavobacteriaceae bacterium]